MFFSLMKNKELIGGSQILVGEWKEEMVKVSF
jgi:hypothetical protein